MNKLINTYNMYKLKKIGAGALASLRPLVSRLYKWCPLCSLLH